MNADELHAYADGRLDAARRIAVQAWLAAHPESARQVQDWQAQNQALHQAFDAVLNEPLPLRLIEAARGRSPAQAAPDPAPASASVRPVGAGGVLAAGRARVRASLGAVLRGVRAHAAGPAEHGAAGGRAGGGRPVGAAWVVAALLLGLLGGGSGGYLAGRAGAPAALAGRNGPSLPRDAALAHAVYTPEQRHPVEVDGRQAEHLVAWLSRRLGTRLAAPQLAPLGYELLGGRLLAAGNGPVAQFMYQDAGGARLTLYVRQAPAGEAGPAAAFQHAREGDVDVFYWVEAGFGYALSGRVDRSRLQAVAQVVHHQLADRRTMAP
ncbi:anti-sigma factor RsiW [Sphaerotilus hippei]|uniref:Anti-sigma factor RsiW n=1 Tax=Sphaerotilus hippei TaxID=744406 RepID=A0A318GZB3_9BURK|nr:anti-sigma factor [Sphaerotilus hippei]PXW95488.1 anti-sigma factor RsiW [Sphaerotilus hippei]